MLPHSGFSQSGCPGLPKVDFWEIKTHDQVRQHVNNKLSGNWIKYIKKLKRQLVSLARIRLRKKAARVSSGGRKIILKGASLSKYLDFSRERISIIQCLADEELALKSPENQALNKPSNTVNPDNEARERIDLSLSQDLLEKLQEEAARRSRKEKRKVSVEEVIIDDVVSDWKKKTP